MRLVGAVCGDTAVEKAEGLARFYEDTLVSIEQRASQIPEEERFKVYHSISDILLTDSKGSLGADWIERVGCVDVAAASSATSGTDYQTTLEQVYVWDPDAIVCNVAATAKAVASDEKWAGLRAVESGRIHTIPTGATRWGQRGDVETYLAMLWLGCTVYPGYFGDIDLKQAVVDYYRDYLGVTVDDALYEQMLSGEGLRSAGTGDGTGTGQGQGR
jgi:iron complex transport system substrate-binding protein